MNSNWLRAAMTDDNLVAEFLLLLNLPDSSRSLPSPPLPPLDWGIRQPRSKAAASFTKELDSRRRSPTTPLSWIASASPSDSFEESSLQLVSAVRFKGFASTDFTNSVSSSKIPRRKRPYDELKEEESSLLEQRQHLSKQMESLQMKLEEQRSCNEKLKRIKFSASVNEQIQLHSNKGHPKREASTSEGINVSKKVKSEEISGCHSFEPVLNGFPIEQQPIFELPDLNMLPIEDCNSERLVGDLVLTGI